MNLVKDLVRNLSSFPLIRDKGLVDIETVFKPDKRRAPSLICRWHRIRGLDSNQKTALKVENGVDIEKDLVNNISRNIALLFECLLQVVEVFEILDVFSLGIDQLLHNMISIGHFRRACDWTGGFIVGVRLEFE